MRYDAQAYQDAHAALQRWKKTDDNDTGFSRNERLDAVQTLHQIFGPALDSLQEMARATATYGEVMDSVRREEIAARIIKAVKDETLSWSQREYIVVNLIPSQEKKL